MALSDKQKADLDSRFSYHEMKEGQEEQLDIIRQGIVIVAIAITQHCPPCREMSLALTHLEEAMFFADAAIVRNGKVVTKEVKKEEIPVPPGGTAVQLP